MSTKIKKKKEKQALPFTPSPFIRGDSMIVPIMEDGIEGDGSLNSKEFMRQSHKVSDKEMNRMIYGQAVAMVKAGEMPPWPEDDSGTVLWFIWNFITPEMREVFPAIAREYLANEPMVGREFEDVPYPMMNEQQWDDAYYFRIIAMMLTAARKGSSYSRNFLLSLYKVYYRQEYNRLKSLKVLTWLDVLEMHDEDCKRKGYSSGHATDGTLSFKDKTIDERKHQPGWTHVYDKERLNPSPSRPPEALLEEEYGEALDRAARIMRDISNSPDEPPLQPASSRLFIMAELLHIPIDATCNVEAININTSTGSVNVLNFLTSPDFRKTQQEIKERLLDYIRANFPETADPYLYQEDERFFALELAETVCFMAFRAHDRNPRILYESLPFRLDDLLAEATLTAQGNFPNYKPVFSTMLFLSMIQYLSNCICELLVTRDSQLDETMHFHRRYAEGDLAKVLQEKRKDARADKVIRTMQNLSEKKPPLQAEKDDEPQDMESLRAELEKLKAQLEEKEFALAESEQKVIQQRALYEKAHENELRLEQAVDDAATEHAELIAMREYVYSLRDEKEPELDETAQAELIKTVQDKNVAVLGGTERWIKRMKRLYPNWKFISVEDDSIGAYNALESADFIYVYTSALKHKQYYKAMNLIRSKNKMLFYLGSTNTAENVIRFYRDLNK